MSLWRIETKTRDGRRYTLSAGDIANRLRSSYMGLCLVEPHVCRSDGPPLTTDTLRQIEREHPGGDADFAELGRYTWPERWAALEVYLSQPEEPPLTAEEIAALPQSWPYENPPLAWWRWLDSHGFLNRARVRAAIAKEARDAKP